MFNPIFLSNVSYKKNSGGGGGGSSHWTANGEILNNITPYISAYWNGNSVYDSINGYALSTSEISALYNSGTGAFYI